MSARPERVVGATCTTSAGSSTATHSCQGKVNVHAKTYGIASCPTSIFNQTNVGFGQAPEALVATASSPSRWNPVSKRLSRLTCGRGSGTMANVRRTHQAIILRVDRSISITSSATRLGASTQSMFDPQHAAKISCAQARYKLRIWRRSPARRAILTTKRIHGSTSGAVEVAAPAESEAR